MAAVRAATCNDASEKRAQIGLDRIESDRIVVTCFTCRQRERKAEEQRVGKDETWSPFPTTKYRNIDLTNHRNRANKETTHVVAVVKLSAEIFSGFFFFVRAALRCGKVWQGVVRGSSVEYNDT